MSPIRLTSRDILVKFQLESHDRNMIVICFLLLLHNQLRGHLHITSYKIGVGSFDFCDKVRQGEGGLFLERDVTFLNNSIFSTFCLKMAKSDPF